MESCCKSGQAIVKFSLFKGGKFKYKKANTKTWSTIEATEPLIGKCEVFTVPGQFYSVSCGFDGFSCNPYCVGPITWIGNNQIQTGNGIAYFNGAAVGRNCNGDLKITQTGGIPKYKFTVTAQNTGAEYLSLTNLDQCPEVQQEGCQLQPEQKFEIELIQFDASYLKKIPGFSSLPIPTVLTECVVVESAVPLAGAECVVFKKRLGVPYNIFQLIQGVVGLPFESVVKVLCSDPNCPPPQVTVVCGEDEKDDQCPPGTDCEIVCKGFKCCYSKGKVIKVIPVS